MSNRILVIGANGQIGWELTRSVSMLGHVTALGRQRLELTNHRQIVEAIQTCRPNIIVNAAGYTRVDDAETNREECRALNHVAPMILAETASRHGALLVHYSTDYVFDGESGTSYTETDIPNPVNYYGETKLLGEVAIRESGAPSIIIRTGWVFGSRGRNFLITIWKRAQQCDELRVVDDQIGSPTWARSVADITAKILLQKSVDAHRGCEIIHVSSSGETSWCGFAAEIISRMRGLSRVKRLTSITSATYGSPALRPRFSVLDTTNLINRYGVIPPHWKSALCMVVDDLMHMNPDEEIATEGSGVFPDIGEHQLACKTFR